MTKLLMVADTYHPRVDGTVRFIEEFLKRAGKSFETTLLVPQFKGGKREIGFKTIFMPVSRWMVPLPTYNSIKLLGNFNRIKKAVQDSDIVFAQGPALASFLSLYYARKFGKKSYYYMHVLSWELYQKSASKPGSFFFSTFLKRICMRFLNMCDEVLIPYRELVEQLRRSGLKAKMTVARLGVDIDLYSPDTDKAGAKRKLGLNPTQAVVGYVGRISKEKNTSILLQAFQRLNNVQLLMVGDGSDMVREFKETKNCKVTGFVDNVHDYLKAMDIFVMPSLTETTSLATLEAMSTGLPVIATKVGFIKNYVVKEHNGLFFPKNSYTMLAAKIEKLLQDDTLREKLGRNARKTVAYSFSWERSINKIKKILIG
jgi:glycosyltransferase involved in cell wall biosynthesis